MEPWVAATRNARGRREPLRTPAVRPRKPKGRDAVMAESHMQECDAEKCLRKMVATKANRTSLAVAIGLAEAALAAAILTPLGAADALFGGGAAGRVAAMACLSPAAAVWAGAVLLTWRMGREASRTYGAIMVAPTTLVAFLVLSAGDAVARMAMAGTMPTAGALTTFALAPLVGPLTIRLALLVRAAVMQSEPWAEAHRDDAGDMYGRNAGASDAGAPVSREMLA